MRRFLGQLDGQWVNIIGELRFFGKAYHHGGHNRPVMLIVNAKANGKVRINHLWVPLYKNQVSSDLREGSVVAFRGKVIPYHKQGGERDFAVTKTHKLRIVTPGEGRVFSDYWSTVEKGMIPCR